MTSAKPLLVVDAANVVGARPDGWWRDRPGAVRRLLRALAGGGLTKRYDVVLVVEGAAREGVPAGTADGVRVVHAPRSGDDEIVRVVVEAAEAEPARPITVVTADRELRERVAAPGAARMGPGTLWDQLDRGSAGAV